MILQKLTFKKAFGLEFLTTEQSFWLMEIQSTHKKYYFHLNKREFEISVGYFGANNQEKSAISLFRHSDEHDLKLIPKIPTLDIAQSVQLTIPQNISANWQENSIANNIVRSFIGDAFKAASAFIDAYRDVQYRTYRGSDSWRNYNILSVPHLTEVEFQTYLFYVLETETNNYIGSFSIGRCISTSPLDHCKLQKTLENELPLERKLIVKAWDYFFQEDYRSTIIYSATVIEFALKHKVKDILTSENVASSSRIDKFIDQTSNRLLSTVVLGLTKIGDETLRDGLAEVFEIRNELIHHRRRNVKKYDAEKALKYCEELLKIQKLL